jgi:hypothetical protein
MVLWLGLALFLFTASVHACTIFVLTDTNRALFCNNEDWTNSNTRIWFIPAGNGHFGCAYVGFHTAVGYNDYPQGGLNTEGLALDWVASGQMEEWEPDLSVPNAWGNSGQRVLETCSTVQDAIAFFQSRREPGFGRARILVADRTGASVTIKAKDGKLRVNQSSQCRGIGYGKLVLDKMLTCSSDPTISNGFSILRACRAKGEDETKYSNIYDLKSGDIFLYPFPQHDDEVKFNLMVELKKGGHYYDLPQVNKQLAQAPRPLLADMKRLLLDEFPPIPDHEPQVTAHLQAIIKDATQGALQEKDFTAELWKRESPNQKKIQMFVKSFGDIVSMSLVDRCNEGGKPCYRYQVEFKNALLLQKVVFDQQNRITASDTEDVESKFDPKAGVN